MPSVTCLNKFTELPSEDERWFARLAAKRAGVPLIESHLSVGGRPFDERLLSFPPSAKPSISVMSGSLVIDDRNEFARSAHAEATWTGQGGDHLFFAYPTALGASDFLRLRGLRPGFGTAIADAARVSGESYRSVVTSAVTDWYGGRSWISTDWREPKPPPFINPEASSGRLHEYIMHPWTLHVDHLPRGKQLQIFYLAELLNRQRPIDRIELAPEHHPLLSQPLIELCLRLPTYTLLTGGRTRGLARIAFRELVPAEILDRQTKGAVTSYWLQLIQESAGFIRELICGGELRRRNFINEREVETQLRPGRPMPAEQFRPFIACMTAELWVRAWMAERLKVAA
jgi:asparagine synthase (glutamine-hydrolysing)